MSLTRTSLTRTVAADATPRRQAEPATMGSLFLRPDATHELPVVVEDERGRVVARFEKPGDAAIFVSPDRQKLPADFLEALRAALENAQQERRAK